MLHITINLRREKEMSVYFVFGVLVVASTDFFALIKISLKLTFFFCSVVAFVVGCCIFKWAIKIDERRLNCHVLA